MTWNPVPNYPEYYASQSGQILSLKRQTKHIMKPIVSKDGHQYVFLYIDGIQHKTWVHRAVLSAWKGMPKHGEEGRHLDDNPTNNDIHNLEWGTRLENVNDKRINGGLPTGERSGTHVLSESDVIDIRKLHGQISLRDLARKFGVSHTAIRRAALGIKWSCVREGLL
jgi:hypothetical protein